MATITGPKIQMPSSISRIAEIDPEGKTLSAVKTDWASYFHSVQQTVFNLSRSGPTASRPLSTLDGRWIGMPYFDTTLGKPIYLKSTNPDVWITAAGAIV